jgi:YihY family inner membrane protein
VERLQAIALPLLGDRRVVRARAVFDRYNAAGGGLLAAGIAYNTLFALVPMVLFAGGLLGFFVSDPAGQESVKELLIGWVPQLAGVVDEVLDGLSAASPSVSIVGLVGIVWGATRLFASLEEGIAATFADAPTRSLVARTLRRFSSIVVIAVVIGGSFVASSVASFAAELVPHGLDVAAVLFNLVLLVLPVLLTTLAIGVVYRFMPPVRPDLGSIVQPAVVVGVSLVVLTRLLAVVAPRVLGTSFVFGTLGTIFVALGWLALAYSLVLIGSAWVRERMLDEEPTAAVA